MAVSGARSVGGQLPVESEQIGLRCEPGNEIALHSAHHDVRQELADRALRDARSLGRVRVDRDAVGVSLLEDEVHALAVPPGASDLAAVVTHLAHGPSNVRPCLLYTSDAADE